MRARQHDRGKKHKAKEKRARSEGEASEEHLACVSVVRATALPMFELRDGEHTNGADEEQVEEEEEQSLPATLTSDFLATFVAPLTREEFFATYWQRRALVIKSDQHRLTPLVFEEWMLGGDLEALLDATPTEAIHVWLRSAEGGPTESIKVDATTALACHRAGASLYFRSPQPLSDALVAAALMSLGAHASGWQPDGSIRGEIETFVSRAGHVTDWHWDFMENFTFQLSGSKRWLFKASGVPLPQRGCTPHFRLDQSTAQMQLTVANLATGGFEHRPIARDDAGVCCVLLEPGDLMYFPSGMYHRVECVEDSLSINVSLEPCKVAEYLTAACSALLSTRVTMRDAMVANSADALRANLELRLAELKEIVNSLTVDQLLPPVMWRERPVPPRVLQLGAAPAIPRGGRWRRNTLAVAFRSHAVAELAGEGDADGNDSPPALVVSFLAGDEDFTPCARIHVTARSPREWTELVSVVAALEAGKGGPEHGPILDALVWCGYLVRDH